MSGNFRNYAARREVPACVFWTYRIQVGSVAVVYDGALHYTIILRYTYIVIRNATYLPTYLHRNNRNCFSKLILYSRYYYYFHFVLSSLLFLLPPLRGRARLYYIVIFIMINIIIADVVIVVVTRASISRVHVVRISTRLSLRYEFDLLTRTYSARIGV